jgi:hypothetical protein
MTFNNKKITQYYNIDVPLGFVPTSLGKCALFAALILLSQAYSKFFSQSPSLVLHTAQCILLQI